MTIAIAKAIITSNMECCLIITVDRIMEKLRIKDPVCTYRFEESFAVRDIAIWAPIEL